MLRDSHNGFVYCLRLIVALVSLSALAGSARAAGRGDINARIEVDRASLPDCPDSGQLERVVEELRHGEAPRQSASYRVEFRLRAGHPVATIVPLARPAEVRTIRADDENCASLARAVAVSLSLMVDEQPLLLSTVARQDAEDVAAGSSDAVAPSSRSPSRARLFVEVEAGAGLGLIAPIAPVVAGRLHLQQGWFGLAVGASFIPEQQREVRPGAIAVTWLGGFSMTCAGHGFGVHDRFRLDMCAGVAAGWLTAKASGFADNRRESRPLLLLPFEGSLSIFRGRGRVWGAGLSAALWVPLRREIFFVAGAGSAYEPPPLAFLLRARLALEL